MVFLNHYLRNSIFPNCDCVKFHSFSVSCPVHQKSLFLSSLFVGILRFPVFRRFIAGDLDLKLSI